MNLVTVVFTVSFPPDYFLFNYIFMIHLVILYITIFQNLHCCIILCEYIAFLSILLMDVWISSCLFFLLFYFKRKMLSCNFFYLFPDTWCRHFSRAYNRSRLGHRYVHIILNSFPKWLYSITST